MLDVIKSDFERTMQVTAEEEKKSKTDFSAFETETKSSITAKTIESQEREREKVEVVGALSEDKTSLVEVQDLLDRHLQELLELQPACIDTGMSYADRVAK